VYVHDRIVRAGYKYIRLYSVPNKLGLVFGWVWVTIIDVKVNLGSDCMLLRLG